MGGGFVPLAPYLLCARARTALAFSVVVTLLALTVFGYIKGRFTGTTPVRSALQTVLVGGLAAAAAFAIARVIA
jgi:VIT1/CCC1 family predicted Fe2+/Mn2+ transporter